jgi:threonine synthase
MTEVDDRAGARAQDTPRWPSTVTELICVRCGRSYPPDQVVYTCPVDGIDGVLDVRYDYDAIAAGGFGPDWLRANPDRTHWRYRSLLPLGPNAMLPSIPVGDTPLFLLPRLAGELGVGELWIKDEGRSATGSFKDRASSVGAVNAVERGFAAASCASTGNAASSLAGFAAHLGLAAFIFVPKFAPEAKVVQLRLFGATVFVVQSTYEDAYDLSELAAAEFGWYDRNAAVNPVLVEGKKTAGLEIAEQTAARDGMPDWVSVSVGDGCTIAGVWKGLVEMHRFGVIDRLPRLLGTQAEGASPLVQAFRDGTEEYPVAEGTSLADSINVGHPRNGIKALRAVRESGGEFVAVPDQEILAAQADLGAHGVFGEPAGVAGIAGIRRAREAGVIGARERVLHVVTGNGLKDVRGAMQAARVEAHPIPPSLDAVREVVG